MCHACNTITSDPANTDEMAGQFAEKMVDTLNQAGLGIMISVGHRTGLFDAMQGMGWTDSHQLAQKANLQERYVREWLGAMATGHVVQVDGSGDSDRYHLPDAHAMILARSGEGMASVFQWIEVMTKVEGKVVDAFKHGGGVPYEAYDRFHEVMAEESSVSVVGGLMEHILPLVDDLKEKLEAGIKVLDIGCGSGLAMCTLAKTFPNSEFMGLDLCQPAIDAARQTAQNMRLTNIRFDARDVTTLDLEDHFDLVTAFDVIHDQRDPAGVLAMVRRVLVADGTFLMQDLRCNSRPSQNVDHPLCPFFYTISTMHCMTVSLAQGGAGLGAVWGEQLALEMLNEAGFQGITVNTLPHDIQNNWYVMHKPAGVLEMVG